jgi:hypothetical protein
MMRKTTIATVAWLLLVSNLGAVEPEPAAIEKTAAQRGLSNTMKASCLLKITWDSNTLPLNESVVEALLHSSGVKGRAVQEVLGLPYDLELDELVAVEMEPLNAGSLDDDEGFLLVRLSVAFATDDPDLVKPAAEELQAALCSRLLETLDRLGKEEGKNAEKRLALADRNRAEAEEAMHKLFAKQRALCEEAGTSDLHRESVLEMTRELESMRQQLEMERVAQQARREAIERQLAETSALVSQRTAEDATVAELSKIVEIQAARVERMKKLAEAGTASETELMAAEEPLARAKAHVVERRQAAAEAHGGGLMPQLNTELAHMNIEGAELNARIQFVKERLEKARPLLELADRFEQEVGYRLQPAREALESAMMRFHHLERRLRDLRPPKITAIGAK